MQGDLEGFELQRWYNRERYLKILALDGYQIEHCRSTAADVDGRSRVFYLFLSSARTALLCQRQCSQNGVSWYRGDVILNLVGWTLDYVAAQ